jgi:hypothetical protein
MTSEDLKAWTRKDLAVLAKTHKIAGRHSMNKHELIEALLAVVSVRRSDSRKSSSRPTPAKLKPRSRANGKARANGKSGANGDRKAGRAGNGRAAAGTGKSASTSPAKNRTDKSSVSRTMRRVFTPSAGNDLSRETDQLVAEVIDPHWIHVRWSLSQAMIDRAAASLGVEWHQALPVIRVFDATMDDQVTVRKTWIRDLQIQGDVDHWFVHVDNPPRSYMFQVGYRAPSGNFFVLACSNCASTSGPRTVAAIEGSWNNRNGDETRNGRTKPQRLGNGASDHYVSGAFNSQSASISKPRYRSGRGAKGSTDDFEFQVNVELIVHGSTHPHAQLTLLGEPVALDADGNFSLQFALPNGRYVIPAVAISPNGSEQRTTVLGVERSTKELEPRYLDELST